MPFIDPLSRLLLAPPATGTRALFYGIALVAIPTLIRLLLGLFIDKWPVFAYVPFVILAAVVLEWKYTAAAALGSWFAADFLFIGPRYHVGFGPDEAIGFAIFLLSTALIIAIALAVRTVVDNSLRPARPGGFSTPVVFSLEGGQAWASWYGSHSWVRLGPEDEVAEMMQDFLAQRELGKRLQSSAKATGNP